MGSLSRGDLPITYRRALRRAIAGRGAGVDYSEALEPLSARRSRGGCRFLDRVEIGDIDFEWMKSETGDDIGGSACFVRRHDRPITAVVAGAGAHDRAAAEYR
jgi:hypothetical protein